MSSPVVPITELLSQAKNGNKQAAEELMPLIYKHLRGIAAARLRNERGVKSLQPSELVDEVYVRLMEPGPAPWKDRTHFFAIAARVARQVLVDHVRHTRADKRGGQLQRVELNENVALEREKSIDVVALDEALKRLEKKDERQSKIVELRFFAGLSIEETAEVLEVGVTAVKDDWKLARAWLRGQLENGL